MKDKIVFFVFVASEIILFILSIIFFNYRNNRYDLWIEKEVKVFDVSSVSPVRGIRSHQSSGYTVIFNALDNSEQWFMDFEDYNPDITENSVVKIKCNPNDNQDAVYLDYEEFKTEAGIRTTTIIFLIVILITVYFYKKIKSYDSGALLNSYLK